MVEWQAEGRIGRNFLNRPAKSNALSSPFLDDLRACVETAGKSDALRVVVLAGRGKAFCGGADVAELASLEAKTAPAFVGRIHAVCQAIRDLPVPVIAQLHGAAIGAGLEIAAACDLRVAAEGTKFVMPEVRLGIPSVVEAALLPRLMGAGRAGWLVLTGEPIDARRALEWGLVEEVGGEAAVEKLVQVLLACDRQALAAQKKLIQLWDEAPLAESIRRSLDAFGQAYAGGPPAAMRGLRRG